MTTHCSRCHSCGSPLLPHPDGEYCPRCKCVRRYPSHRAVVPRGFRCPSSVGEQWRDEWLREFNRRTPTERGVTGRQVRGEK